MKKLIAFLITVILTASALNGCSVSPEKSELGENSEKPVIVCTIFPQYDAARRIAGENMDVVLLLKGGADIHSYEPTPADVIAVNESDLFIRVGGVDDVWQNYSNTSDNVIKLMDEVEVYEEVIVEGMQDEEDHAHEESHEEEGHEEETHEEDHAEEAAAEYDEHVWLNPNNMITIAEAIRDSIIALDKENSALYSNNCVDYVSELRELDTEIKTALESKSRNTLVFGDRFPFRYFTEEYGLAYYAAFPGCSTETDASAATLTFLIDKVKAENIPVVYYIENGTDKIAQTIANETGAEVLLLNSCHTVTEEELSAGIRYIDLMRRNIPQITKGLN